MMPRWLNPVLAAAFAASLVLMWASRRDVRQPNAEFLPDMAHTPRYGAFAANPVFADGKTLQAPPEGTIPRGFMPVRYTASSADAARAGDELSNPFGPRDAAARARGEQVFVTFCAVCHGAGARGDGPVTARGVPPPPSLISGKAATMKDGQLFHIVTFGQKNMASYASQVSREDRWRVILYVRSLQTTAAPQQ